MVVAVELAEAVIQGRGRW